MTVFGYARVSTLKQADDGYGLDVQENDIKKHAARNKWNVELWFRDKGVSGSIELKERVQGKLLLQKARHGDIIVCSRLDRMFRSARDALNILAELKERGIKLHVLDLGGEITNGNGNLVFTIFSAVAEQERERIKERIVETKQLTREQGKYQGGHLAFGYKKDRKGNLVKDEHQQKCIKAMKRKREEGMSYRAISKYVNDEWELEISHNAVRQIVTGKRKLT